MLEVTGKRHRILAPRLVFLIGTRSADGTMNIIPITNVTSVSVEPCRVIVAVYKPWQTCSNLRSSKGFTLSLASKHQLGLIWKLGAKYSGYESNLSKMTEFRHALDLTFSRYGPVLKGALGWMEFEITNRPQSAKGDHMMVVGECWKAMVDPSRYTEDITPKSTPKPLMQWERNSFSTSEDIFKIAYYKDPGL